jgi:hypothetical protein
VVVVDLPAVVIVQYQNCAECLEPLGRLRDWLQYSRGTSDVILVLQDEIRSGCRSARAECASILT